MRGYAGVSNHGPYIGAGQSIGGGGGGGGGFGCLVAVIAVVLALVFPYVGYLLLGLAMLVAVLLVIVAAVVILGTVLLALGVIFDWGEPKPIDPEEYKDWMTLW